jgi:hypothetical protein
MCEWKHSLRTSVQRPKIDLGIRVLALSYNELGGDSFLILASVLGLNSNLREVYMLSLYFPFSLILASVVGLNSNLREVYILSLSPPFFSLILASVLGINSNLREVYILVRALLYSPFYIVITPAPSKILKSVP